MATERQITANRLNASRSSGPKTSEGKARSRSNATRHGLAGESADLEAESSPEFADRRAKWGAEYRPEGDHAHWALDRAVAASLRIERCERAVDTLVADTRMRASLTWEEDRAVEAAMVFGRLARDPVLASRQLQTTRAGVTLLLEAWLGLASALESGDWSESETSRALDLLGVAADLRQGRTPIDAPDGADRVAFVRELVGEEVDRLETLRDEAMEPLDQWDRRQAMSGDLTVLSKPARLLLRYEREAWRRYRESIGELQAPAPAPAPIDVAPSEVPNLAIAPSPSPSPSFEEERREVRAMAEAFRLAAIGHPDPMDPDDEDAWIEELERRTEAGTLATERTRFDGVASDRDGSRVPSR